MIGLCDQPCGLGQVTEAPEPQMFYLCDGNNKFIVENA